MSKHPKGMIDLRIVPESRVMDDPLKVALGFKKEHYVLIVRMK